MKTIYMCTPEKFSVEYIINPWMSDNVGKTNITKVRDQWSLLHRALIETGADVRIVDDPIHPDATFIANAGLIVNNDLYLSRFQYDERQPEEDYFNDKFLYKGFTVVRNKCVDFEGAGDALFSHDNKILWIGTGSRTSTFTKSLLEHKINATINNLDLIDNRFYHLDTCFCPLDTGDLLWYPGAFSEKSISDIKTAFGYRAIEVTEADALMFGCNAVSVDKNIVMPVVSFELASMLTARDYDITMVDMSEFMKSGGACKCLTLQVNFL